MSRTVRRGLGKGKVYPHEAASQLLNPLRRLVQAPSRLVARLRLRGTEHVLELGPGPGYFSIEIAHRLPGGQLHLLDLQHQMLGRARGRLHDANKTNARFAQGDATALPYRDDVFDVALLVAVLGEVPDREMSLRELRRVLRPDGRLAVCEMRGDPDRISPDALRAAAIATGFDHVDHHQSWLRWWYLDEFRCE